MKKLRLELDSVEVESFVVAGSTEMRGTVEGKNTFVLFCQTNQNTCWNWGCNGGISSPEYCPTAEDQTCNGWPGCPPTGADTGYTADQTCSDYGCTVCNAWC